MAPILFHFPDSASLAESIRKQTDWEYGAWEHHRFPDGESRLRILNSEQVKDRDAVILLSLDKPNQKIIPLLFLARLLRAEGAARVGLAVTYLAYMRQDKSFHPGEGISQRYFAGLLDSHFDWLVTLDPHLHRISSLTEIFTVPARHGSAAGAIGKWIHNNIEKPVIIGPDEESRQWAEQVAGPGNLEYLVLNKIRRGDKEVEILFPEGFEWQGRQPVLVDDIISTGRTMIETALQLEKHGARVPVCIGVHGLFTGDAREKFAEAGIERIITCDSVPDPTNAIDISSVMVRLIKEMLPGPNPG